MTPHWTDAACWTDPTRRFIASPFGATIRGVRYRVATDGHALLAVEDADAPDRDDAPKQIGSLFSHALPTATIATTIAAVRAWGMPCEPDTAPCHVCNGTPPPR